MLPDFAALDSAKCGNTNSIFRGSNGACSFLCSNFSDNIRGQFGVYVSFSDLNGPVHNRIRAIHKGITPIKITRSVIQRITVFVADHRPAQLRLANKRFGNKAVDFFGFDFLVNANRNLRSAGAINTLGKHLHLSAATIRGNPFYAAQIRRRVIGCARYCFPYFHTISNGMKRAFSQRKKPL